jgi:hypothetical protein
MPENEYENWSDVKLEHFMTCSTSVENRDKLLAEFYRRQKNRENQIKSQYTTSIRWSKIAGIAAIVAAVFALAQIILSLYLSNVRTSVTRF